MNIENIKISNYRSIDNFELNDIKPVTIFVGRNNTGKSSLLESIALLCSGRNCWYDSIKDDLLNNILQKRGGFSYSDTMININSENAIIEGKFKNLSSGRILITKNTLDLDAEILNKIDTSLDDMKRNYINYIMRDAELEYSRTSRGIAVDKNLLIERARSRVEHIFDDIHNNINLIIVYEDELTKEYSLIFKQNFIENLQKSTSRLIGVSDIIRSSGIEKSDVLFMLTPTTNYLEELQKGLAKSGDLLKMIKRLKEDIPYFEDLREVEDKFYIFLKNIDKPFIIDSMGDGFKAKLGLTAGISTISNGIVILEEPETRLHPGFILSVCNHIIETAEKNLSQFFISTHSLDFINMVLKINPKICTVIRTYKNELDMKFDIQKLSGDEALNELTNLERDLRGY
jgi:AAA15 family ATPase/GTPase